MASLSSSRGSDLLALRWPRPPQNILLVRKKGAPQVTQSLIEFANLPIPPFLSY
ncbi:conserved hypothetical protein [Histoplasma mississippiense (nom. inval.)]|uniref:conserved hypothetical protein n=1 Tax=Ajellomyces capsulatus (strain NAm1 / WU24) TaxID=2059318 RepID=UPI000157C054|nr:conserved hypothetical protein [Histoplasma mississippiense (nom. inval.)]EDN06418.1 conserved hypothetical protein [Histoplasma mississippiense (nom. inval.)]